MTRRSSRLAKTRKAPPQQALQSSPPAAPAAGQWDAARLTSPPRRISPTLLVGGLIVVAAAALALGVWIQGRNLPTPEPVSELRLSETLLEGKGLCERFMALKNAGDPAADRLLGRVPVVPSGTLTQAEAEPLQTDFFLRSPLRVVRVEVEGWQAGHRRTALTGRLVLNTKGNASAPKVALRTPTGVESPSQRVVCNPDLVVEVRDGKIYGVRIGLYMGP